MKGVYEHAYAPIMDRVWVVSESDGQAMRRVVGANKVVVVPNGVDSEFFSPRTVTETEHSCVFWGSLDFGPNIQAIQWFYRRVWHILRKEVPDATFTIYGFNLTEPVKALAGRDGVLVIPDLPDLRDEIAQHAVVVLPFVSGGGIKNKLLEAASLAKAVVGSSTALNGLRQPEGVPMVCAKTGSDWAHAILDLWSDEARRAQSRSASPRVGDPEPLVGAGGATSPGRVGKLRRVVGQSCRSWHKETIISESTIGSGPIAHVLEKLLP